MKLILIGIFSFLTLLAGKAAGDGRLFWEVGQADDNDAEFAIGNHDFSQWDWNRDVVFAVGKSRVRDAWPYIQPGPADAWAGSQPHTFRIEFGVRRLPDPGDCSLEVRLIDTHYDWPPGLQIRVNGTAFEEVLPKGGSDASAQGHAEAGKRFRFTIHFPASLLRDGNNEISITTVAGCWMLYDWIGLTTPAGAETEAVQTRTTFEGIGSMSTLVERDGKSWQSVPVILVHVGESQPARVHWAGGPSTPAELHGGAQTLEVLAPPVATASPTRLMVEVAGTNVLDQPVTLQPVPHRVVYLLMHSHNDIGYTDVQPNIAKKQAHNVVHALELIRQTKDYPAGSRFKWNLEVLMPAEDFYQTATPEQKREFEQAVRDGDVGVDAMYANLLTGLCRSEELLRQLTFARDLGRRCGVNVDSMMLSDVPGMTWGIVPALAQNGVRYISDGPNSGVGLDGDRIGYVREAWENKPFYWLSQSGREKVLFWSALGGYSFGHHYASLKQALPVLFQRLDASAYPYDIVQLRWSKGDNGPADEDAIQFVRDWNAGHEYPKIIIATTSEAFHAFEKRYGAGLPSYRGDLTPYWDDGAGSGASETALNRHSVDRLLQAETLWAMLNPGPFPVADFVAAWKNAALWDEHTWGAWNSISDPDNSLVQDEWHLKQAYALNASQQSRELLARSLAARGEPVDNAVDVFNTASWPRTDLVTLPKETRGDVVRDESSGQTVPSQRLSTGELVFLAGAVPPLGAKRFLIEAGTPPAGHARVAGTTLSTPELTVTLSETTGAIVSVRRAGLAADLAGGPINNYLYLPGAGVKDVESNGPVTITVKESGPLVAELSVQSTAPGCHQLVREVRLVDGLDRVEISDLVDKRAVRAIEGVHFGFAFNVTNPVVRINSPGAVGEIEKDQLPGACKNWFAVERWVDVANDQYGVTWSTADAPLVEVGGLTANLPRSQPDPNVYLKTIRPSSRIYSWVMNNHWETNYRADQEGPVWFRYALHPHHGYDPAEAMRFGVESTETLITASAAGRLPSPRLSIQPAGIVVSAFKPSDDGKATIVRLFNVSGKNTDARLKWSTPPGAVFRSDASELPLQPVDGTIQVPAWDLVTLRLE